MLALQIERKVWKKESNFSLTGNYSMQFLNDHMGEPRVDGHFNIPGLPQGITVKAMNINLSNETDQFISEIVSVLSTFCDTFL